MRPFFSVAGRHTLAVYIGFTLSSHAVLAIPHYSNHHGLASRMMRIRQQVQDESAIVTQYGFPNVLLDTEDLNAGGTALAPLSEVFKAMATVTGASIPQATITNLGNLETNPAAGGLVIDTPAPPTATSAGDQSPHLSSRNVIIFGSLIGGTAFLTLCLFFLMDPRVSNMVCWKKRAEPKLESTLPSTRAWKTSRVPAPSFVDEVMAIEGREKTERKGAIIGDAIIDVPLFTPHSKFSVSISDYSSCRESYSSGTTHSSADISPLVSRTPPSPTRPPRPPTADSPALSDSVYLACSDQPYIIVAPQPLSESDYDSDTPPPTPSKILTPSEFAMMYAKDRVPFPDDTPATPPGLYNGKSLRSGDEKRHSRTRSAPTPMFLASQLRKAKENEDTTDATDFAIRRVLRHRRSRSASGWAYPTQRRQRRRLVN